jgi:DNA topoisomerase VI subunit B
VSQGSEGVAAAAPAAAEDAATGISLEQLGKESDAAMKETAEQIKAAVQQASDEMKKQAPEIKQKLEEGAQKLDRLKEQAPAIEEQLAAEAETMKERQMQKAGEAVHPAVSEAAEDMGKQVDKAAPVKPE